MSQGQIAALVWGPLAIVMGICFVRFRERISRAAQAARGRHQTPALMATAGIFFTIAGAGVLLGALTGALH
ncbi:hypothetical protein [Kineococcus sp. SYSU DK006]|uniref:hypothetical protein n=1 Tax=Kineococcus sp. SYSU DK006 TaxID=3383127 RepID=UPI003D7E6021